MRSTTTPAMIPPTRLPVPPELPDPEEQLQVGPGLQTFGARQNKRPFQTSVDTDILWSYLYFLSSLLLLYLAPAE